MLNERGHTVVQGSFHGFARLVHFRYYNGYFEATICGTEHCFVLLEIFSVFLCALFQTGLVEAWWILCGHIMWRNVT